ncbi:MAG: DEAD/DEAH box helicase [Rhodospirillales bacterium]|nr:DEAD/DEAH box helicase [Rhodospirillales bacterium]
MPTFDDLGLTGPILTTLAQEGYTLPTPIQAQAIPHVLAGHDLLGIAQTGTGKTAAFALPILARLAADRRPAPRRGCRALILSPTRELASQIAASFRTYGRGLRLGVTTVFGGVAAGPQVKALAAGVDILVATPGRLLDHAGSGAAHLAGVEALVLDEADQMLNLGFILPIRRIIAMLPAVRQNLLFSATMPPEIGKLAADILRQPVEVRVAPAASTVERVDQRVIHVDAADKRALLSALLADGEITRALVFTRTKHGADKVVRNLMQTGVDAAAIHGNKTQAQRERALAGFRAGRTRVLVATDIAARGIDVDDVSHIINYELPNVPETYVHRIGRTARAGAAGTAVSFCDRAERTLLRDIERLIRRAITVAEGPAMRMPPAARRDATPPVAAASSGAVKPKADAVAAGGPRARRRRYRRAA